MRQQYAQLAVPHQPKYGTAASRWAGIGPYYAMFPTAFADAVISKYTRLGETILDPFAGRGTAIFSAAVQKRPAIGIEISPLGYVYANAKLKPGNYERVTRKLEKLGETAHLYRSEANNLPPFFHHCFAPGVLEFLVAAREKLKWKHRRDDRTLMAIILVSLHGKRLQSLSNQMRQSTAMAPDYCIRWWTEKNLAPPSIDPVAFFTKRIKWRYAKGIPQTEDAIVHLGDSIKKLPQLARSIQKCQQSQVKLLITSPPYSNVTNYYYDQWLRLWLLGGPEYPSNHGNLYGGKFSNSERYYQLLNRVFARAKRILANDAIIYIRTDRREPTLHTTRSVLKETFPEKHIIDEIEQPLNPARQTRPYSRGGAPKKANCEVDIILEPR